MATRANITIVNASGGEVSPELYSRIDIPIYSRANQRIQNYFVVPQGGLLYRNGLTFIKSTRNNQAARVQSFNFSDLDTYVLEFTDKKIRFYRSFGAVLTNNAKTITAITQANPVTITSNAHGLTVGTEVCISGVVGMPEINNQFFTIGSAATNQVTLKNAYGENVNSAQFAPYVSGGTMTPVYEIDSPYLGEHVNEVHMKQSADTIYCTHQRYAPYKLTREGHTNWSIHTFERENDPFKQKTITAISKANPGVFTSASHGFAVDDEVYIAEVGGMTEVTTGWYKINTVPSSNTFTLKDVVTGTPLNTTSFSTFTEGGIIINTRYCPKTVAFLDTVRLVYGNWLEDPTGLAMSMAPNSKTGETRFDNFDIDNANAATDAVFISLQPVFDKIDSIQWIATVNRQILVGCVSSVRKIYGDTEDQPISPSSLGTRPVNNVGAIGVQPYSSGQSLFYIDSTGRRINTILFSFQSSDYVTANQHLAANQLGSSRFVAVAQQRGDSGLLWVLREDGVLTGLTFNELESIYGWHRHYIGGKSKIGNVEFDRAKVLSITTEPRFNEESTLWTVVERQVNGKTLRSVEYLNQPVRFVEADDFYSGDGYANQQADIRKYVDATYEQLKDSIHLDGTVSYDGGSFATVSLTPTGTTGDITLTASGAIFESSMVGRQVWKKYNQRGIGGGRIEITGVVSSTVALGRVLSPLDNTDVIPIGGWYLTTNKVYGLLHLVGETVDLQLDGAPGGKALVRDDGTVELGSQTSKAHAGFGYLGLAVTLNLDLAGPRGSTQTQIRKMRRLFPRFRNTVGAKIGTTLWNCEPVTFKDVDDLTDRPTRLFEGVCDITPPDSHTRQRKQVFLMQDIPSPQQLLALDIELEAATD